MVMIVQIRFEQPYNDQHPIIVTMNDYEKKKSRSIPTLCQFIEMVISLFLCSPNH